MTPYTVLGLSPSANKDQVKEAFRKLVWKYHPDKAQPEMRVTAEAKFKEIKLAYEAILQNEAGYGPPRPGSAPNPHYAEAYWHAHSADGRVPWGAYAGWETEWAFYRAMFKSGRNNMALLTVLGLLAVPSIAAGVAIIQSFADDPHQEDRGDPTGLDTLRGDSYVVNGRVTMSNPWATSSLDMRRYREAQARLRAAKEADGESSVSSSG